NEARVKVTAELGDAKTMDWLLRNLLNEANDDSEVMVFATRDGQRLSIVNRRADSSSQDFEAAAADVTRAALGGEPATGSLAANGRAYGLVAVPVATEQG